MRTFAKWLVAVLITAGLVILFFWPNLYKPLLSLINSRPCEPSIQYTIGSFDPKFGISETQFLGLVARAEKIWEDKAGKELFQNAENGSLKINLIYDYRQAATKKLQSIGLVINDTKETYNALKAKYESLASSYKVSKAALEAESQRVKELKEAYEGQVEYWNSKGGAPKNEYQKLAEERVALNEKINKFNLNQINLNDTADTINSLATVINQLIDTLNLNVEKYNDTSASTGEEFDEGVYISDKSGIRIDIYQFANEAKLVRVLAHELGHALGMSHVSDDKAIMYRLNQASSIAPTDADMAELERVCGIK